jgi:hypothetical protein
MIKKTISWSTYLDTFYDFIRVNTANNKDSTIETPIFYYMNHGTLTISFAFDKFYIEVHKNLAELQQEYNEQYSDDFNLTEPPRFLKWLNDKYMDERGINER